jgi:hypothetical protein
LVDGGENAVGAGDIADVMHRPRTVVRSEILTQLAIGVAGGLGKVAPMASRRPTIVSCAAVTLTTQLNTPVDIN